MPDYINNEISINEYSLGHNINNILINLKNEWGYLFFNSEAMIDLFRSLSEDNYEDYSNYITGFQDMIYTNWNNINEFWDSINFHWESNDEEFRRINHNLWLMINLEWETNRNLWENISHISNYIDDSLVDFQNYIEELSYNTTINNNNIFLEELRLDL